MPFDFIKEISKGFLKQVRPELKYDGKEEGLTRSKEETRAFHPEGWHVQRPGGRGNVMNKTLWLCGWMREKQRGS